MSSIKCACKGADRLYLEKSTPAKQVEEACFSDLASRTTSISMRKHRSFPRLAYLLNPTTFYLAGLSNVDKLHWDLQFFVIKITLVTKFLNNDSKAKFELDFYCMSYFHIL